MIISLKFHSKFSLIHHYHHYYHYHHLKIPTIVVHLRALNHFHDYQIQELFFNVNRSYF